jgi:diguanylate cyclase (GGDEF)-like protein
VASVRFHRFKTTIVAAAALVVVIGTLAYGIEFSQDQSRSHVLSSLALRGTSSATFVSAYLHQAEGAGEAAEAPASKAADSRRRARIAASGAMLQAFVDHTIAYAQHEVFLIDAAGRLVAASPRTSASSLEQVDPALARAIAGSSLGPVAGAKTPSTFTVAAVPATSWRLVIAVPNARLYQTIDGWVEVIPWIVLALVSVLGVALVALFARLTKLSQTMATSARTDALTGLANRRAMNEHLTRAAAYARRHRQSMSVLMIDLDRFKRTNDCYGHAAGDRVLRAVAEAMRKVLRAEDIPGRWGGDEFIVLMPSAQEHDAQTVAARLQQTAAEADLSDIGLSQGVEMSVGVASATDTSSEEIVHAADLALYQAKASRGGWRIPSAQAVR